MTTTADISSVIRTAINSVDVKEREAMRTQLSDYLLYTTIDISARKKIPCGRLLNERFSLPTLISEFLMVATDEEHEDCIEKMKSILRYTKIGLDVRNGAKA